MTPGKKNDRIAKKTSLSRDLNTGPADYKSAALPTKPLRRHTRYTLDRKKDGVQCILSRIFLGWTKNRQRYFSGDAGFLS